MKLPIVKGRNLKRQKIDEGVPFVEQLAQETPGFHYYGSTIMNFLPCRARGPIYRTFLNEGMRAGIPNEATRARTITLYLDKPAFRKALDIDNEQNIWLYLFDKSGNVHWRIDGKFNEEKGEALRQAIIKTRQ
jgi:hypothetical protein